MSTFLGHGTIGCWYCGDLLPAHGPNAECPRPVSQSLSRVVAGPTSALRVQRGPDGAPITDGHLEACWTDGNWWMCEPGCQAAAAPASSLIADVAAFRALSPEVRAALLRIGGDGEALLNAAEMVDRDRGDDDARNLAWSKLHTVLARIDARRS